MRIKQFLLSGLNSYKPKSNKEVNNTLKPAEIVIAHLRTIENSEWDKQLAISLKIICINKMKLLIQCMNYQNYNLSPQEALPFD